MITRPVILWFSLFEEKNKKKTYTFDLALNKNQHNIIITEPSLPSWGLGPGTLMKGNFALF